MSLLPRGIHETILTEALVGALGGHPDPEGVVHRPLRPADAADRLALHVARVVERALQDLPADERVAVGLGLVRRLLAGLTASHPTQGETPNADLPAEPARVLEAVLGRRPDGRHEEIALPHIPLLDTTLLTNAPGEPNLRSQILTEIASADRIDAVIAFIRRSGIRDLLGALRTHCAQGRALRVLTTTYTASTEQRALDELVDLGADVRVSYDLSGTRLHAKAWLLHRASGFSTAYIGSSNLTHQAQVTGLEWNVRVSGARNPSVVQKVTAVFDAYWESGDFVPYDAETFARAIAAAGGDLAARAAVALSPLEIRPEPFQARLLEQLGIARSLGRHKNLLVAATGTGKTVMAALDYARLRATLPRARLLFVAHREEILAQSQATFRHALRQPTFGELWVGGKRPTQFEHVFASIQSLAAAGLDHLAPDHFDVVIVDEFHHAAAQSYRALLDHLTPHELLGLTSTPERADGESVLDWFDGRIAAELRLWDAIDQHRLAPFAYYGIHDGLDLREVPWKRGRGYDVDALSNLLTSNDVWARVVLQSLQERVDHVGRMRALGFCVSVAHARFMARIFNDAGIKAVAIWADTPDAERRQALADLAARRLNIVFSVDLFNEGVDVPVVDTLLMLRPSESATLFLQQLGRGLRKHPEKGLCTVLDFVGHHRAEFRFDQRFRALLGGTRKDVEKQIQEAFPFLPAGCHMELDRVAQEIVLKSVRSAIPSGWSARVRELRDLAQAHPDTTLAQFLERSGIELEDVYANSHSWSELRQEAGLAVAPAGPEEATLRRAPSRLLHIDDLERIDTYRALLAQPRVTVADLPERQQRALRMLVASVCDQALGRTATVQEGADLLWQHPQVKDELVQLLDVLHDRITHLPAPLRSHPHVPLQVHARYTRLEILAAFSASKGAQVPAWQTGIRYLPEEKADLLVFTLDKTEGQFSPTTRYRDYAISRDLIHWESQSVTRENSETGKRYRTHAQVGSHILLFARLRADQRSFYFLGSGAYVKHEAEQPMAVTWKLDVPLPGDLFAAFAAAVA